jgi:uncharacterized protein (TIGR03067 family)
VATRQQAEAEPLTPRSEPFAADKGTEALERIQGTWILVSVESNGGEIPDGALRRQKFVWVIKGDKITHRPEIGLARQSKFELDPTKMPNEISVRPVGGWSQGRPKRGIYSLEDDCLKLCVNKDKDQLPIEFSTRAGDGLRILVFKRHRS